MAHFSLPYIYIFVPIISAAHLVYHDVLAELLSKESWGVRESNDAGSANGPTIPKHCKHVRISQDFLVSVGLAKWGLTRLGSPSICVFSGSIALSLGG